jgi:hypothetical protein
MKAPFNAFVKNVEPKLLLLPDPWGPILKDAPLTPNTVVRVTTSAFGPGANTVSTLVGGREPEDF